MYLLFDCNKKSCCTDVIGAKHVNYDLLVHIGEACFSEKFNEKHYYVLPEAEDAEQKLKEASAKAEEFGCDAILLGQSYYDAGKQQLKSQADVLLLPMDAKDDVHFEHLLFGYYK